MLLELADHDGDLDQAIAVLRMGAHPAYGEIIDRLEAAGRDEEALAVTDEAAAAGRITVSARPAAADFGAGTQWQTLAHASAHDRPRAGLTTMLSLYAAAGAADEFVAEIAGCVRSTPAGRRSSRPSIARPCPDAQPTRGQRRRGVSSARPSASRCARRATSAAGGGTSPRSSATCRGSAGRSARAGR